MCSDIMCASPGAHMQASRPPLCKCGTPEITCGCAVCQAKLYLTKLTLNTKIANQNMLKMILIAMHNENKADCNENFKICAEESVGPL